MEPMAFLLFEKGGILLYESVLLPACLNVLAGWPPRRNEELQHLDSNIELRGNAFFKVIVQSQSEKENVLALLNTLGHCCGGR